MKANLKYIAALLLGCFMTSCGEEADMLQQVEEESEALIKQYDPSWEERGLKPRSVNNNTEETSETYGEKGRDRRDLFEDFAYKSIEPQAYTSLWTSALYVETHDHEKGECELMIYWEGGYSPEAWSNYTQLYGNVYANYSFNAWSLYNIYYHNNPIEFIFYGGEKVYSVTDLCYEMGDKIVVPSYVCEHCTSVEIIITRPYETVNHKITFKQPYIPDFTVSPWTNYYNK